MPELGDNQVGITVFKIARQESEMVILDEHECGTIIGLFKDRVSKQGVDFAISLPVLELKDRSSKRGVAERPESLICQAVVVALLFFLRQPHPAQRVSWVFRRHADMIVLVNGGPICIARAMPDPDSAGSLHHRVQGRGHATRGTQALDRVTRESMDVSLSIRNNDHLITRHLRRDEIM
jgi:hypothetical protein